MGVTVCVPKPPPRDAQGPPGEPALNRCLGKLGQPGGMVWPSPGMGRDHLLGCRTGVGFLTYQLPFLQERHPGLKGPQTTLCTRRSGKRFPRAGETGGFYWKGKIIPLFRRVLQAGLFAAMMDFSCGQWACLTMVPKVPRGAPRKAQALQLDFLLFPDSAVRRSAQKKLGIQL